jgi:hypothetical protein
MPRALRQLVTHRRALIASSVLLTLTAVVPGLGLGAGQLAGIVRFVVGPVQQTAFVASRWLVDRGDKVDPAIVRHLEQERDQYKSMFLAAELELRQTRERLQQYETGIASAELGVRHVVSTVMGPAGGAGSHMLKLRAGTRDGVFPGTVAVAGGVQIAGRVVNVGGSTSTLVLITQPGIVAGAGNARKDEMIGGVILFSEARDRSPDDEITCQLTPFGDGTLRGMVEYKAPKAGEPVRTARVGQFVYLKDPSWPRTAQMLALGRVEDLSKEAFDSALRQHIRVRPLVRLDLLTEVVLRIPGDADDGAAHAEGRDTGGDP